MEAVKLGLKSVRKPYNREAVVEIILAASVLPTLIRERGIMMPTSIVPLARSLPVLPLLHLLHPRLPSDLVRILGLAAENDRNIARLCGKNPPKVFLSAVGDAPRHTRAGHAPSAGLVSMGSVVLSRGPRRLMALLKIAEDGLILGLLHHFLLREPDSTQTGLVST